MELLLLLALPLLAAAIGFDVFGGGDGAEDGISVNASNGDDSVRGTNGDDLLVGNGGDDTLRGFGGDDTLRGNAGRDLIDGGAGDDFMRGGDSADVLLGLTGRDTIYGDNGDDFVMGEEDNDLLYLGAGNDVNWVSRQNDSDGYLFGQLGDDTIYGEAGNDDVFDYSGRNKIYGGAGDDGLSSFDNVLASADIRQSDAVYGGAGNDLVIGDYGDTLSGGTGEDTFRAFVQVPNNAYMTIDDYNAADDALQITVDPSVANAAAWKLTSSTNNQTGDVSLFLQNVATPSSVIDLALLKAPTGFQLSQVDLQFLAADPV